MKAHHEKQTMAVPSWCNTIRLVVVKQIGSTRGHVDSEAVQGPFSLGGLTLIPAWIKKNTSIIKCEIKLHIHFQTSTMMLRMDNEFHPILLGK